MRRFILPLLCVATGLLCTSFHHGFMDRPPLHRVLAASAEPAAIAIEYPRNGTVFPAEITAPTFIWNDAAASRWKIDLDFADGSPALHFTSDGPTPLLDPIDPQAISATNEPPQLPLRFQHAHAWKPSAQSWTLIKAHSTAKPVRITLRGYREAEPDATISCATLTISTSKDPVGAPIFYRDVPLMPSETEKGVIKPLAANAIPLIQWKLRSIGQTESRTLMTGIHTCANCHSFSADGKTMGIDMDGPRNDKGLYAVVPIRRQMSIRNEDMVNWNPTQEGQFAANRVAFMSQISPDGRYVLSMVTRPDRGAENNYYVANFKDYRFLQVFYPTRGILAVYDRRTGTRTPLPGADDPHYVQTGGVWSPDGKYIVFARAEAREPYALNAPLATQANDPHETQIRYDLYRIPFNNGQGGRAEPIAGASANGMSNSFPKISPDGKWIVFVKAHNGLLMRPDSKLFIIPSAGGVARPLNANMEPMNSWHSWSPNSRWLVFSSKSRGPYTRMYLTHIDADGNDTPPVLIDNVAAGNRAINLPEFVNIPGGGIEHIATPAVEMYRRFDEAVALGETGRDAEAVALWKELLREDPDDARVRSNLAGELMKTGQPRDAAAQYMAALRLNPQLHMLHGLLAAALLKANDQAGALHEFEIAVRDYPNSADLHNSYGGALARASRMDEAVREFHQAITLNPRLAEAYNNLGIASARQGDPATAMQNFREAARLNPSFAEAHNNLGIALLAGAAPDAAAAEAEFRAAIAANPRYAEAQTNLALLYQQSGKTEAAMELYRAALASDEKYLRAYSLYAGLLAASGQTRQADLLLEEALKIAPGNAALESRHRELHGQP